jgi:hypothetical protein
MSWIKRNLPFVIGSAIALVLMGLAGWFLYVKWSLNNDELTAVNSITAEVKRYNSERPHPGVGAVNNITNAQDQTRQLREFIAKSRAYFAPIAAIPSTPKVEDQAFSRGLSSTIKGLQDLAASTSVSLPAGYFFSFEAMKTKVTFAPGSLERLAVQLGEVKAISEILLRAKINSLTSFRRERVSADDSSGPQTDYLTEKTITNELAVVTPYETTFTCFSEQLGVVLTGFATSPHGFMVKSINVTAAPSETPDASGVVSTPQASIFGGPPQAPPPPVDPRSAALATSAAQQADMYRRYGLVPPANSGSGASGARGGVRPTLDRYPGAGGSSRVMTPPPAPTPPSVYAPPAAGAPPAGKGAFQTVLDEKLLTVTIALDLIKLLPTK